MTSGPDPTGDASVATAPDADVATAPDPDSATSGAPLVSPPALDLVIVHRRRPRAAVRTARLFLDQGVPVRVLVVDNGSPERDLVQLRASLPADVDVLELGANTGFGPGANAGFRWFLSHDPAPWLGVAPHDAEPEPGCLRRLLAEAGARPGAGLASADVGDGLTPVLDRYFGAIPAEATVADGWEPAGYPHGTLMVARRRCLEDVGLFDERYFAYCEEAELALRAQERGWEVGVVRGAGVRNRDVGSHAGVVDYLQLRNTLLMVREHSGRYHSAIRLIIALWQLGAGLVVPARRGPYWSPRARLRAIADHLRSRYGPPPEHLVRTCRT
jgi:N-acetylglucosaminyl-diphospho-decaprenol L-rhamnosyltransferase